MLLPRCHFLEHLITKHKLTSADKSLVKYSPIHFEVTPLTSFSFPALLFDFPDLLAGKKKKSLVS